MEIMCLGIIPNHFQTSVEIFRQPEKDVDPHKPTSSLVFQSTLFRIWGDTKLVKLLLFKLRKFGIV
jgi:hypothetical protein